MNYILYKLKDYYTTPLDCSECAKLYKYHVQKITDKKNIQDIIDAFV